jgi:transposase
MRSGTRSECKEKWTPQGQRPTCKLKLGYEYCYLYAAINPYRGELFCLILPDMTKESFQVFNRHFCSYLDALYPMGERPPVLLIADGAGAHQRSICERCGLTLTTLPPAAPELNPVERFFEELRKELADRIFETIDDVELYLSAILTNYFLNPQRIIQLTLYPYLRLPN